MYVPASDRMGSIMNLGDYELVGANQEIVDKSEISRLRAECRAWRGRAEAAEAAVVKLESELADAVERERKACAEIARTSPSKYVAAHRIAKRSEHAKPR